MRRIERRLWLSGACGYDRMTLGRQKLITKDGIGYIERDGRLHLVWCVDWFKHKPLLHPTNFKNTFSDKRENFFVFTTDPNGYVFYQTPDSENPDMVPLLRDTPRMFHGRNNDTLDLDEYQQNMGILLEFLRNIEQHTGKKIVNIHVLYNSTYGDATNRVRQWHDDRRFAEGKYIHQMVILLNEGNETEFAIGEVPDPETEPTEGFQSCNLGKMSKSGSATYWYNPILHRKPLQAEGTRRLAILVVFDFLSTDTKTIGYIEHKLSKIKPEYRAYATRTKEAILDLLMEEKRNQTYGFMEEINAETALQQREIDILTKLDRPGSSSRGGSSASVKKEPVVNCLETDHPSCSAMFGGTNDPHAGKYKYKGRWYKVRYGARGGRHILVKGVVKYV